MPGSIDATLAHLPMAAESAPSSASMVTGMRLARLSGHLPSAQAGDVTMANWTLDQAVRDAFESERAAMRFFEARASAETSNETRALYLQFAESAQGDASKLESVASRVEEGEFAHYAEID